MSLPMIHILKPISEAYKQSPLWTLMLPGDAAAGLSSAAWTPIATELARQLGASATVDAKRAAYGQVVAMLSRTAIEATQARHLSATDRLAFGGLIQVLLQHYQPLAAA